LQIQGPELVDADHDRGFAVTRFGLAVGDRVQPLDPGLLLRELRVGRALPGLQALKGDAFLAEQDA
jgi:hypothetical protein